MWHVRLGTVTTTVAPCGSAYMRTAVEPGRFKEQSGAVAPQVPASLLACQGGQPSYSLLA